MKLIAVTSTGTATVIDDNYDWTLYFEKKATRRNRIKKAVTVAAVAAACAVEIHCNRNKKNNDN
jgi:hypothetical protein